MVTPGQKKVLCRVHYSNKEIAEDLKIQICTVKTYVKQLFNKFQAANRCELVLRALRDKTITLDEIVILDE